MSNNSNDELKCHLNRILLINYDEEKQEYKELPSDYKIENKDDKDYYSQFYIIIVCTQNSLSGTKKHFQNYFKRHIKLKGFELLSKVDATKQGSRRNLKLNKNYNVRTRVYYRKNMVHLLFDNKKFLNSYNRTKWITTRRKKTNTRKSNSIENLQLEDNFNKYPFIMHSYNIFRDTYDDKGYGLICVNLNFYLSDNKILSLLVINENKKTNNRSCGSNEVGPIMNKNTYESKFKINNNVIITTTCTIKGITTTYSEQGQPPNNKLTQFNKNRNEININNKIKNIINQENIFSKKRLLLKIPYLNKIIQIIEGDETQFKIYATILIKNATILKKCDELNTLRNIIHKIKTTNQKKNKNNKNKAIEIDAFLQNDKTILVLSIK